MADKIYGPGIDPGGMKIPSAPAAPKGKNPNDLSDIVPGAPTIKNDPMSQPGAFGGITDSADMRRLASERLGSRTQQYMNMSRSQQQQEISNRSSYNQPFSWNNVWDDATHMYNWANNTARSMVGWFDPSRGTHSIEGKLLQTAVGTVRAVTDRTIFNAQHLVDPGVKYDDSSFDWLWSIPGLPDTGKTTRNSVANVVGQTVTDTLGNRHFWSQYGQALGQSWDQMTGNIESGYDTTIEGIRKRNIQPDLGQELFAWLGSVGTEFGHQFIDYFNQLFDSNQHLARDAIVAGQKDGITGVFDALAPAIAAFVLTKGISAAAAPEEASVLTWASGEKFKLGGSDIKWGDTTQQANQFRTMNSAQGRADAAVYSVNQRFSEGVLSGLEKAPFNKDELLQMYRDAAKKYAPTEWTLTKAEENLIDRGLVRAADQTFSEINALRNTSRGDRLARAVLSPASNSLKYVGKAADAASAKELFIAQETANVAPTDKKLWAATEKATPELSTLGRYLSQQVFGHDISAFSGVVDGFLALTEPLPMIGRSVGAEQRAARRLFSSRADVEKAFLTKSSYQDALKKMVGLKASEIATLFPEFKMFAPEIAAINSSPAKINQFIADAVDAHSFHNPLRMPSYTLYDDIKSLKLSDNSVARFMTKHFTQLPMNMDEFSKIVTNREVQLGNRSDIPMIGALLQASGMRAAVRMKFLDDLYKAGNDYKMAETVINNALKEIAMRDLYRTTAKALGIWKYVRLTPDEIKVFQDPERAAGFKLPVKREREIYSYILQMDSHIQMHKPFFDKFENAVKDSIDSLTGGAGGAGKSGRYGQDAVGHDASSVLKPGASSPANGAIWGTQRGKMYIPRVNELDQATRKLLKELLPQYTKMRELQEVGLPHLITQLEDTAKTAQKLRDAIEDPKMSVPEEAKPPFPTRASAERQMVADRKMAQNRLRSAREQLLNEFGSVFGVNPPFVGGENAVRRESKLIKDKGSIFTGPLHRERYYDKFLGQWTYRTAEVPRFRSGESGGEQDWLNQLSKSELDELHRFGWINKNYWKDAEAPKASTSIDQMVDSHNIAYGHDDYTPSDYFIRDFMTMARRWNAVNHAVKYGRFHKGADLEDIETLLNESGRTKSYFTLDDLYGANSADTINKYMGLNALPEEIASSRDAIEYFDQRYNFAIDDILSGDFDKTKLNVSVYSKSTKGISNLRGELRDTYGTIKNPTERNYAGLDISTGSHKEFSRSREDNSRLYVARDSEGQAHGASFVHWNKGDTNRILDGVGSVGAKKGTGDSLLRQIVLDAAESGHGISGTIKPDAKGFWEKYGLVDENGKLEASPEQIDELAKKFEQQSQPDFYKKPWEMPYKNFVEHVSEIEKQLAFHFDHPEIAATRDENKLLDDLEMLTNAAKNQTLQGQHAAFVRMAQHAGHDVPEHIVDSSVPDEIRKFRKEALEAFNHAKTVTANTRRNLTNSVKKLNEAQENNTYLLSQLRGDSTDLAYRNLSNTPAYHFFRFGDGCNRFVNEYIFKPLALLTPGWAYRVSVSEMGLNTARLGPRNMLAGYATSSMIGRQRAAMDAGYSAVDRASQRAAERVSKSADPEELRRMMRDYNLSEEEMSRLTDGGVANNLKRMGATVTRESAHQIGQFVRGLVMGADKELLVALNRSDYIDAATYLVYMHEPWVPSAVDSSHIAPRNDVDITRGKYSFIDDTSGKVKTIKVSNSHNYRSFKLEEDGYYMGWMHGAQQISNDPLIGQPLMRAYRNLVEKGLTGVDLHNAAVEEARKIIDALPENDLKSFARHTATGPEGSIHYHSDPHTSWAMAATSSLEGAIRGSGSAAAKTAEHGLDGMLHARLLDAMIGGYVPTDTASFIKQFGYSAEGKRYVANDLPLETYGPEFNRPQGWAKVNPNRALTFGHDAILQPIVNTLSRQPTYVVEFMQARKGMQPFVDRGVMTADQANVAAETDAAKNMIRFIHNPMDKTRFENTMRVFAPFYFAQNQAWRRMGRLLNENPGAFIQYLESMLAVQHVTNQATAANGISMFNMPLAMMWGIPITGSLSALETMDPFATGGNTNLTVGQVPRTMFDMFFPRFGPLLTIPAHWFLDGTKGKTAELAKHAIEGEIGMNTPVWQSFVPNSIARDLLKLGAFEGGIENYTLNTQLVQGQMEAIKSIVSSEMHKHLDYLMKVKHMDKYTAGMETNAWAAQRWTENTPEYAKLLDDSKSRAGWLFAGKIALGLFSPVQTGVGMHNPNLRAIINKWGSNPKKYGAFPEWVDKFAEQYPADTIELIYKSKSVFGGQTPETKPVYDATTGHEDALAKYPMVGLSLLGTDMSMGDYYAPANTALIAAGLRKRLMPAEFIHQFLVTSGNQYYYNNIAPIYDAAKTEKLTLALNGKQVSPYTWKQAKLTSYGTMHNPTWFKDFNSKDYIVKDVQAMDELQRALKDPLFKDSPIIDEAKAVCDIYLPKLQSFQQEVQSGNNSFSYADIRTWWRDDTIPKLIEIFPNLKSFLTSTFSKLG